MTVAQLHDKRAKREFRELMSDDSVTAIALIDASGNVTDGRGDIEELAGLTAFSLRLGTLVGDTLGLDELVGIESRFEHDECVIRKLPTGTAIAIGSRGLASKAGSFS